MNFERRGGVKETLGIGKDGLLKTMGGRIIGHEEYKNWKKSCNSGAYISLGNDNLIILVENGTYEILKNRFGNYSKGPETELIRTLLELLEKFNKWDKSIWIDADGNVGIGTRMPSVKLNIK
jgi:hypothetical protein